MGQFENGRLVHGQHMDEFGTYLGHFSAHEDAPNKVYFEGQGLLQFKNGDVYQGEWKDGQFEGYGTFQYAKSTTIDDEEFMGFAEFKGTYKNGKRSEGTLKYENGDIYVGTFEDGMKECGVQ